MVLVGSLSHPAALIGRSFILTEKPLFHGTVPDKLVKPSGAVDRFKNLDSGKKRSTVVAFWKTNNMAAADAKPSV